MRNLTPECMHITSESSLMLFCKPSITLGCDNKTIKASKMVQINIMMVNGHYTRCIFAQNKLESLKGCFSWHENSGRLLNGTNVPLRNLLNLSVSCQQDIDLKHRSSNYRRQGNVNKHCKQPFKFEKASWIDINPFNNKFKILLKNLA